MKTVTILIATAIGETKKGEENIGTIHHKEHLKERAEGKM